MPSKADTAVARTIGIDTGKNTLHMIGLDEKGAIVLREKVSRTRIATRLANVPPCLIGIEAGMASHHVARELVALGHEVKRVPPSVIDRPNWERIEPKPSGLAAQRLSRCQGGDLDRSEREPVERCVRCAGDGHRHGDPGQDNGKSRGSYVDGRSTIARRYKDISNQLAADQGGADQLREARLRLIRRFAACACIAEQLEAALARGEQIDIAEHAQLCSSLVRIASRIGIDRIPREVTPTLREYLKHREQAEFEPDEEAAE